MRMMLRGLRSFGKGGVEGVVGAGVVERELVWSKRREL